MKRLLVLFTIALLVLLSHANYSVYSTSGKVTVIRAGKEIPAEKGMTLNASDQIDIASGAKVEIYNAKTQEIFASVKSGKNSVMGVMLDARKQASNTSGAINSRMKPLTGQVNPNSRVYTEGLVKRSMQTYDPGAESRIVDPRALALHIVKALRSSGDETAMTTPAGLTRDKIGESGKMFRAENTQDFPVYFNIIKVNETSLGSIEISELGQPMGCYVLLPNQTITREHPDNLNMAESHILVMANYRFDIDELIEEGNKILSQGDAEEPDNQLPVYIVRL